MPPRTLWREMGWVRVLRLPALGLFLRPFTDVLGHYPTYMLR
jgi:hypothetical protein